MSFGSVITQGTVTKIEVIDADSIFRTLNRRRASRLPPRLIHCDDQPVGIEQGELHGQGVEDGCLLATQVILSGPQPERPSVSVRHSIDLACGQFFQALRTRVQGVDQRRDFVAYLAGKR